MPNMDGTGPRGLGRMTGRGKGYCHAHLVHDCLRIPAYQKIFGNDDENTALKLTLSKEEQILILKKQQEAIKDKLKELEDAAAKKT